MKSNDNVYWTHNTAYHKWILSHAKDRDRVLDVGCGDGLLVQRLSHVCGHVIGIDPHMPSAKKAKQRLVDTMNALITTVSFENFVAIPNSFDLIIFVASLHHMNQEFSIRKAKSLLTPGGELLVVGCANPRSFADWLIDISRVLPARLGSLLHGEKNGGSIGVPTEKPSVCLADIRNFAVHELPGAKIRQGLYYRYLLSWIKQD